MIKTILDELIRNPHYGVSERVEIAKGKYELIRGWSGFKRKLKRLVKYGKKN